MKRLYLVRHAKSSWDNPEQDDIDRPLSDRGHQDAPVMGQRLSERHIHPDAILTSPAVRARATCEKFAKALGFPQQKIKINMRLYHADEDQLLMAIKELKYFKVETTSVMIFGHNPGLTEFANRLLDDTIDNIPTCGVVAGELYIRSWSDADWGCGKLEFFDFPKRERDN